VIVESHFACWFESLDHTQAAKRSSMKTPLTKPAKSSKTKLPRGSEDGDKTSSASAFATGTARFAAEIVASPLFYVVSGRYWGACRDNCMRYWPCMRSSVDAGGVQLCHTYHHECTAPHALRLSITNGREQSNLTCPDNYAAEWIEDLWCVFGTEALACRMKANQCLLRGKTPVRRIRHTTA
jgi:hypothetical protein